MEDFQISGKGIVKYTGQEKVVVVPEGIQDIEDRSFYFCDFIEKIILPDSVKRIGTQAFGECAALREIHLPKNLTVIGHEAFDGCRSLTEIVMPDTVQFLGRRSFAKCSGLKRAVISRGLRTLSRGTFFACVNLKELTLPETITGVDEEVFYLCRSLEEISLPSVVSDVGRMTFYGCSSLQRGYIPGVQIINYAIDEQTMFAMLYLSCRDLHTFYQQRLYEAFMRDQARRVGERIIALKCHPAMKVFLTYDFLTDEELAVLVEKAREQEDVEMTSMLLRYKKEHFENNEDMWEL